MAVYEELRNNTLIITIDNPPVNALSVVERAGLIDAINKAEKIKASAVIIQGTDRGFIAGADVREFGIAPIEPHLPEVVDCIEAASMPVVSAIRGQALGGGLEVALACHYRIADPTANVGLPEVTLGLVPGAGGTQRLPRLLDPVVAAKIVLEGKPIPAEAALEIGLIDLIVEGDITQAALDFVGSLKNFDIADRRLSSRNIMITSEILAEIDLFAQQVKAKSRGAVAPYEALDLIRAACTMPFAEGYARERQAFLRLRNGEQAAALRHIFFAERLASKPPEDIVSAKGRAITNVGVIGAGTMGTGIAMSIADAGFPVTIVELSADAMACGMERIFSGYEASVKRDRLSAEIAAQRIARIKSSDDYASIADCDLVIEAAFEDLEVKRQVFTKLDKVAKPGAILASNTSYLDMDVIADFTSRAQDVVGLHFFSPANIMRLLEVVRGRKTESDVLVSVMEFAKAIGKQAVIAGVCHGFIGNRMLKAYVREAGLLLLEGASAAEVDTALESFGMAMGPFAVADLSGIDIGYKARRAMQPGSFDPLAVAVHDALVECGQLGQKTGAGFYVYTPGSRQRKPNPVVLEITDRIRENEGIKARAVLPEEIVERCMRALANEGSAILEEGIAARSSDIDVVYVNGYGFPRHRGGPMWYAMRNSA